MRSPSYVAAPALTGMLLCLSADASFAAVRQLKVAITKGTGGECMADIAPQQGAAPVLVSMKKRDVLAWNVENTCGQAERVQICIYGAPADPVRKCNGDPSGASLYGDFVVDDKDYATISCHVKWGVLKSSPYGKKKYTLKVFRGEEAESDCDEEEKRPRYRTCPNNVPCPKGSELAMEVDP